MATDKIAIPADREKKARAYLEAYRRWPETDDDARQAGKLAEEVLARLPWKER